MPIKFGANDVGKAHLGAAELSQIYLGSIPILEGSGPEEPVLPPVTDGLVEYIDCGVYQSWDALNRNFIDLAGDGSLIYTEGSTDEWIDPVGVAPDSGRDVSKFFAPGGVDAECRWSARTTFNEQLQWRASTFTAVIVIGLPASTNAGVLLSSGEAGEVGINIWARDDGIRVTRRWAGGGPNRVDSSFLITGPWDNDPASAKIITYATDNDDDNPDGSFVKINGHARVDANPFNSNTTQNDSALFYGIGHGRVQEKLPVEAKIYASLLYNRKLSDAEVSLLENFFLTYLSA